MRHRILSIAALVVLTTAALGAPAVAGGPTTWYVDDDEQAGAGGCDADAPAIKTIQEAVDASGPDDTIRVCPGSYPEQVEIAGPDHEGLRVIGVRPWEATLSPGALSGDAADDTIVRIASDDVTVQWLRVIARTSGSCENAQFGIKIDGVDGARVISNRVGASTQGSTRDPACGLSIGISAYDGSTNALVRYNMVRDFQVIGIQAHGATGIATKNNSVRYRHEGTLVSNRRVTPAIPPTGAHGIRYYQATGKITGNAITSREGAGVEPDALGWAISSVDGDGLTINGNTILRTSLGIQVEGMDGGAIRRNQVTRDIAGSLLGNEKGIVLLASTNNRVTANRVFGFPWGIALNPATSGNLLRDNNALGNITYDCVDHSGDTLPATAPADPIDNTWIDNLGAADIPDGLCENSP